jgi:hypothetical protein
MHNGKSQHDIHPHGDRLSEARLNDAHPNDLHVEAAAQHELAAKAHRTASEHNEKGDDDGGRWHSERALEYSNHAYKLAKEAHNKSGRIESN